MIGRMELTLETTATGVAVARLTGRLDLLSAGGVREQLNEAVAGG